MKKIFMAAMMAVAALTSSAQNIQIHYDFGKHIYNTDEHNRQDVTITYEGFKADGTGSWYYFIDADINKNGLKGAYTEISREFNVGKKGFAAHMEFDAGLDKTSTFQSAALVGAAWNGHNADFSTTYSVQLMYKQFFGQKFDKGCQAAFFDGTVKPYSSFQLTGVWSTTFANNKLTFSGFVDLWRGVKVENGHGCLVFLTEPQLWYNVSKHCSLGTEFELSNNFVYSYETGKNNKFYFNPTLAFKYNF